MGMDRSISAVSVYGDSLVFPHTVLGSKLKAQLVELRFPCSKIVPRQPVLS